MYFLRQTLLFFAFIGLFALPMQAIGSRANQSVSGSQQFIVICDDRDLRQNLVGAFDEVRRGLFAELSIALGAQIPIYVTIAPRKIVEYNAKTWNIRWLDTPEGARVQLDVLVDDDLEKERLQAHIVSALLLTLKYRDNPPPGGEIYTEAPAWLVEGLSEKIRQQNQEPDAALYRGLLNAKNVPELADWMKINPAKLDETSLGIYRAYACALVNFFQGEPNGGKKLKDYLQKAPADPQESVAWLAKTFPSLGPDGKNLAKWWSLSLAKLSATDRYVAWSGQETNAALDKSLVINLTEAGEKKKFTLAEYADFMKLPGRETAVAALGADLTRLTIHAHPLFRPVIVGYQDIVDRLQRGKLKNLDGKIDEMEQLRSQLTRRLTDVSDYLTWYEATQLSQASQASGRGMSEFDGYFRLMQSFKQPRPPSREPIGRYLDAMEAEMKN